MGRVCSLRIPKFFIARVKTPGSRSRTVALDRAPLAGQDSQALMGGWEVGHGDDRRRPRAACRGSSGALAERRAAGGCAAPPREGRGGAGTRPAQRPVCERHLARARPANPTAARGSDPREVTAALKGSACQRRRLSSQPAYYLLGSPARGERSPAVCRSRVGHRVARARRTSTGEGERCTALRDLSPGCPPDHGTRVANRAKQQPRSPRLSRSFPRLTRHVRLRGL
jgi:hypothetical protein